MLPAASGTKTIAWCRTVAESFFSRASKIALFQMLSWYEKKSCAITSRIRQAVISQATFQLLSEDQKPRAVRQKRRTSGLCCSRSTAVSDMKTLCFARLTRIPNDNAAKFQKFNRVWSAGHPLGADVSLAVCWFTLASGHLEAPMDDR